MCYLIVEVISLIVTLQAIVLVPNAPPTIGIVTKWGKRLWKSVDGNLVPVVIKEGWHWLFLRKFMYGLIIVDFSKKEIDWSDQDDADFAAEVLQTKDGVTTSVPVSIAFTIDEMRIINLLNLGTADPEQVLKDMMDSIVKDKLRAWARTLATWEDLLNSKDEAVKTLIESICGPDAEIPEVDIQKIRSGQGKWGINYFAIFLNRVNLGEMQPFGEVYKNALKLKNEKKQREAEVYETGTEVRRAQTLRAELKKLGVEKSLDDCLKQVMNWKITREANKSMSLSSLAATIASAMRQQPQNQGGNQ